MKYLNIPTEFKALGDAGQFSGYAAIFGNVDLGGDIIEPGAFKQFAKNKKGKITVLWQHNSTEPIGLAEVSQDEKGLAFDGELVLEDPLARTAFAHMKAGSVNGMSIGYDVLENGSKRDNAGIRTLSKLKLWEISAVTFGMNPLARIEAAKAAAVTTIREFEEFLREAGYSKSQSLLLASGGWPALQSRRDSGDADGIKQLFETIQKYTP